VPEPYGSTPLAITPGDSGGDIVVAPVAPGEVVWLGFQAVDRTSPVSVRVRIDEPQPIDAISGGIWDDSLSEDPRNFLLCPPDSSLAGPPVPGGRRLLGSDSMERFTLFAWGLTPVGVTVQLVRPAEFARVTGRFPPPLNPGAAFTGRRLP
jgi:hypothetical protein